MVRESIFVRPFFPGNQSGREIIRLPSNDTSTCLSQRELPCIDSQWIFRDSLREYGKAIEENDLRYLLQRYIYKEIDLYNIQRLIY